jgi:hypothetical protein
MEDLQIRRAIIIIAFIILLYIAVVLGRDYPVATAGLIAICGYLIFGALLRNWDTGTDIEKLTQPTQGEVITDLAGDNVDEDEYMGPQQNIRLSEVDTALQRPTGLNLAIGQVPTEINSSIDTSDVVQRVLTRGNVVYEPNMQGVSATTAAQISNFNLAEPGPTTLYSIARTNKTNVDEQLTRKQMHRGAMNKKAIDGKVRSTKNIYQKYFLNELDENEHKVWYSAEAEDLEMDFRIP